MFGHFIDGIVGFGIDHQFGFGVFGVPRFAELGQRSIRVGGLQKRSCRLVLDPVPEKLEIGPEPE